MLHLQMKNSGINIDKSLQRQSFIKFCVESYLMLKLISFNSTLSLWYKIMLQITLIFKLYFFYMKLDETSFSDFH